MGNSCLKGSRSSSMVWAETEDENDHWVYYSDPNLQQKQTLLLDETICNQSNPSITVNKTNNNIGKNKEVKIMLSKKKLEELLGKVDDLHNTPVNQILDRLINSSNRFELNYDDGHLNSSCQQPWKPKLQSIPEEN